ncbi:MAG: YgjP-like metallopeptidase domain-containing protein [Candidatus Bipolaricaulota bacterium]
MSRRARHVHLRFSVRAGLEVVIPMDFDPSEIPDLLTARAEWIADAARQIEAQRALADPSPADRLPAQVSLRALGETWNVELRPSKATRLTLREAAEHRLIVSGPLHEDARWRRALKRWVARRARLELARWAEREAETHGLPRVDLAVRWQRARWGSCSRRSGSQRPTLSLNAGLLFLPPHLARYVILHELCHTQRMDHSPAFWNALQRVEPAAPALREELHGAWPYIPSWVDPPAPPVDADVDRP